MTRRRATAPPGPFAEVWRDYRWRCVPAEAGPRQVGEARRAFYAGAEAAVQLLADAPSVDTVRRIRAEIAEQTAADRDSMPGGCGPEPAANGQRVRQGRDDVIGASGGGLK